jgi:hypothetical protein
VQNYSRYIIIGILLLIFAVPALAGEQKIKYKVTGEKVFALKGSPETVKRFQNALAVGDSDTLEKMLLNKDLIQLRRGSTFWKTNQVPKADLIFGWSKVRDDFVIVIGLGEDCVPERWD